VLGSRFWIVPTSSCQAGRMTVVFVLVHSPLVGPLTWDALAASLRAGGHRVSVPDLRSSLTDGPPYWSRQVAAIVDNADKDRVILVGHSGAGPLLPAIGKALERVAGYVFIDAGLPFPGRSWLEQAPPELAEQLRAMARDGWLPPWSEWWGAAGLAELLPDADVREHFSAGCPRLPMAMFEEAQPLVSGWPDAPCAYLRLSEAYQGQAERGKAHGWPTIDLSSHHLAVLTDPDLVLEALLDLVRRIQQGPSNPVR
jgi:pimeloyl-ACP methyl ester carboxylesterase